MLSDLVKKCRSCRKFDNAKPLDRVTLEGLVDLGRQVASGGNLQPLKYFLSADADTNNIIYPSLRWAGYLKDWDGPEAEFRPTGYIIFLRDNEITSNFIIDHGLAVQTVKLGAAEQGIASCIIGSVDRKKLRADLEIPTAYELLIVLALGYPAEASVLEKAVDGDIHYWRDEQGVMHIPKRSLDEVIINND